MSHTPGPWETGRAAWDEEGDVMYSLHGIKEATVADCRLIQAAPDLLSALKAIQKIGVINPAGAESVSKAIADMDAAISKAEGRQ